MEFIARTDLAVECWDTSRGAGRLTQEQVGPFRISCLAVEQKEDADACGKPIGRYVTVECGRIHQLDEDAAAWLSELLAERLRDAVERASGRCVDADFGVLVAGLGNAEMTVDAIGPLTVARLHATRHLREHERALYDHLGCAAVSTLAPGVLGQTGVETLELLRGVVSHVRPDAVVVIDALAARSCERLASTVQLSDAGIAPGSGVGNHRSAITRETLGVPVVALGVPTVIDSATLIHDALAEAGIFEPSASLARILENRRQFFVSPRECDLMAEQIAALLARTVAEAFGLPI